MKFTLPWAFGITNELNSDEKKRVLLVNSLALFFLGVGIPISYFTLSNPAIQLATKVYVVAIVLVRLVPLVLNHLQYYRAAAIVLILLVNYTITTMAMALGSESQVDLCYIIVAGLPYFMLDRQAGSKRLWLSLLVFPLWIIQQVYTLNNPPLFQLSDAAIEALSYFYKALLTVFTIFLYYMFSRLTDKQVEVIEQQSDTLRVKNKQQEQFNYIATHDLKTPVANIEGFYQILQDEMQNETELTNMALTGLGKSIEQSQNIIADLVEITRSANIIEEVKTINLSEVTESILSTLSQSIKEKNVTINLDFNAQKEIRFGKIAIRSILQNLISNAVKYSSDARTPMIQVRALNLDGFVVIEVEDNGIGIDLERQKDKLFGAFQRFHTHQEGSGIGLFMTKRLVEDRGGKIEIQSEVDKGSRLRVYLPNEMN